MPTALLTQALELPAPTRPAKGRYSLDWYQGQTLHANFFLCVCVHCDIHTGMLACRQDCNRWYVCKHTCTCMYAYVHIYMHLHACKHTHACTRTYAHTCTLFLSLISWHPTHPHTWSPFCVQRTVHFLLSYTHSFKLFNTRKIHFPSHPLGSVLTMWRLRRGGRSYFLNWDWNRQCPNIVFHSLRLSLSLFAYSILCLFVCWSCVCMH